MGIECLTEVERLLSPASESPAHTLSTPSHIPPSMLPLNWEFSSCAKSHLLATYIQVTHFLFSSEGRKQAVPWLLLFQHQAKATFNLSQTIAFLLSRCVGVRQVAVQGVVEKPCKRMRVVEIRIISYVNINLLHKGNKGLSPQQQPPKRFQVLFRSNN